MYYYVNDAYRGSEKLIKDIEKAINGEYTAIYCYERLSNMTTDEKIRNRILEIRNDEMKHYKQFTQIYMNVTGRQAVPQMTETCPNHFLEGVEIAIEDEQETVDSYLEIAAVSTYQNMKDTFIRAALDEQNHAVWFLYIFSKLRK